MSLVKWVGIKTARELPECESILASFGYSAHHDNSYSVYKDRHLWIDTENNVFLYSSVAANGKDTVITQDKLAETLVLYQLGVAL
jgi:hypothetical protein